MSSRNCWRWPATTACRSTCRFMNLTAEQRQLIVEGVPERNFGGLKGFFAWLERRKYKMHIRVFLSRWRSYRVPGLRRHAAADPRPWPPGSAASTSPNSPP